MAIIGNVNIAAGIIVSVLDEQTIVAQDGKGSIQQVTINRPSMIIYDPLTQQFVAVPIPDGIALNSQFVCLAVPQ